MDFGKLPNVDNVNFALPKDRDRSLKTLRTKISQNPDNSGERPKPPRVYVGAPLWSVKEWVGKIYPAKTPARDYLAIYSRRFNSIELNSTFYRVPDAKTVRAWAEAVPENFVFSPKLSQFISHQDNLLAAEKAIRAFFDAVSGFGAALGMSFL